MYLSLLNAALITDHHAKNLVYKVWFSRPLGRRSLVGTFFPDRPVYLSVPIQQIQLLVLPSGDSRCANNPRPIVWVIPGSIQRQERNIESIQKL